MDWLSMYCEQKEISGFHNMTSYDCKGTDIDFFFNVLMDKIGSCYNAVVYFKEVYFEGVYKQVTFSLVCRNFKVGAGTLCQSLLTATLHFLIIDRSKSS